MDKKTLLAVTVSAVILMVWFGLQTNKTPTTNIDADTKTSQGTVSTPTTTPLSSISPLDTEQSPEIKHIYISTDIYDMKFSSKNGTLESLRLKHDLSQVENNENVELIPKGDLGQAFRIMWGDDDIHEANKDIYYRVRQPNKYTVEFYQDFISATGIPFTLNKSFTVKDGEHIIDLRINITNSKNSIIVLGDNYAYSLLFGPQLGPFAEIVDTQKSKQLSRRRLVGKETKKARNINVKTNRTIEKNNLYRWVGISGRYISMLILTGSTSYTTQFSAREEQGLNSGAQILLRRPDIQSSAVEDRYRIYIGPNVRSVLNRYNKAENNAFGIQDAEFNAIKPGRLLGFLEKPIYALMKFIYSLLPNYGIAIILLTLVVRAITLPVIKKSKKSGERMKAIGPKMKIIREKYANDPVKMNQEVMKLYKKENVSPFSTMVPMLIQIPFFLAMYRVIYESFDLWQAPFFGWITDLSSPDEFISFGNFAVPFLGWTSLHLLPIIMLATQYVSSFIMMRQQDHSAGSPKMMFIMSYVFPFMIFFALYNSPSGLIVYWICSNIFTVFSMADWKKKNTISPILTSSAKSKIKK